MSSAAVNSVAMNEDRRWPAALYAVADLEYAGDEERLVSLLAEIGRAAAGRPVAIQLRAKLLDRSRLASLAARAREAVPRETPLLLNGDDALAAELGYDGVHWPEASVPDSPPAVPLRWRCASVHSPEAARRAERAGAAAVVFGAVFEPLSKPGAAAGLDALRAVVAATSLPVLAIGGVTPERVAACMEAGAAGVAAVSGVLGARPTADAIDRYLEALRAVAA